MNPEFLVIALIAVVLGGLIKGLSGFGYAIVSTALLASFFPPQRSVAFMIIPLIAIELELVSELDRKEIRTCVNNFEFYILALIAGTLAGFYMISAVPESYVRTFLGALTLAFALSRVTKLPVGLRKLQEKCFRRSVRLQMPLGFVSGLIFGATNIAVQVVAYLKSMEISNRKFVGLLALVMVPISALRLPLIIDSGFSSQMIAYSLIAAFLGMLSASLGRKTSERVSQSHVRFLTVSLLVLISFKLISSPLL